MHKHIKKRGGDVEMGKLNAKQEMFCMEYLVDLNATQAAIRAGYSTRTAGSQAFDLLKKPDILMRVKELKDKRAEGLELDAYWVLKRLKDVSDRCMQAEPVLEWDKDIHAMVNKGEWRFDSLGAAKSAELIGKHVGVFNAPYDLEAMKIKLELAKKDIELKEKEIELKQVQIEKLSGPSGEKEEDDGFMDALHAESGEVFNDDSDPALVEED